MSVCLSLCLCVYLPPPLLSLPSPPLSFVQELAASPGKSDFFKWPLCCQENLFPSETRTQTQAKTKTKTKNRWTSVLDWSNQPSLDSGLMKSRRQKLFRQSRTRLAESIWAPMENLPLYIQSFKFSFLQLIQENLIFISSMWW